MFFVDNSGHTFELTDYTRKPIGYEFDETPYVFWLSDNNENSRLSINNYYCRAINILFPIENISDFETQSISDILKIDLTLHSNIFSFIPSNKFQEALNNSASILDYICAFDDYDVCKEYLDTLNKNQIIAFGNEYHISSDDNEDVETIKENILSKLIFNQQELSSENDDDFVIIKVTENNKNFILIPIYVIGNASEEGTWSSTALLHISYKYSNKDVWCPFSVGGTFVDSYEALIIHGKNMGVNLPKDIIKALNGTSFFNDEFNMEIYNKKLKEYMLNYMAIKGECGNYNSALTALKWFGWQDKVTLYKLVETSNEFKHQFIRDYFDIHNDIIEVFKNFIHTQYVSLQVRLNVETGELDKQNVTDEFKFWGEGNRLLHSLINNNTLVNTKEYFLSQEFSYVDSYFKYSFNELLLKISCLSYYYKKYFLPLYLQLKNVSVEYKVYANQIKLSSYAKNHFFENIVNLCEYKEVVSFDTYHVRFLTHQYHYVDSNYNEFYINGLGDEGAYAEHKDMWYLINDSCISVPIHFKYWENDPERNYYNCMLFLKDDESNKPIFSSSFSFLQTENNKYNAFIIYPKLFENNNPVVKQNFINKYFTLYLYVNGTYFDYKFQIKAPEFDVSLGTLEYKYWDNDINYLNEQYHSLDKVDTELYANTDTSGITVKNIYLVKGNIIDESNKILEEIPNDYLLRTNSLEVINTTPGDEYYIIVSYDLNTLGLEKLHETDIIMTINDENIATISHCEFDSSNSISHIIIKINEDTTGCTSLAINVNGHITPIYINNSQVRFIFHDAEDTNYSEALDITEYIKHRDFFDSPTKYMSPFVQIDSITDDEVKFNTFMHEPEFVSINDLNMYLPLSNDKILNDLIGKYKDEVNISNNYKYLNNVHLYELYGINEKSEDNYTDDHDILKFYKDIMVRVGDTVISKSKISNTFTIVGSTDNVIETIDGFNYYARSNKPELIEGHAWYYILKRDKNNQITGENANSLYSIYNDTSKRYDVGYLIFDDYSDIRNNVSPLFNGLTIDYNDVEIVNNQFIYHHKSHNYVLNYTNTFVRQLDNGRYEEFQPSTMDFHYNYGNIFIKMNFYYYEEIKTLNLFGYYNSNSSSNIKCSELDEETKTCIVTIYDPEDKDEFIGKYRVQLYPSKYYEYTDKTDGLIYNQNASAVWATLDENDNLIPNDIINELTLEYYTEDTLDQLNLNDLTIPAYINYLAKDLTGISGKYRLACDTNGSNIKVKLVVKDKNGIEKLYEASIGSEEDVSLYGDEQSVILYFEISEYNNENGIDFTPHLYKYEITEFGIPYDPANTVNMYKKLFYKKYSLVLKNDDDEKTIKEIWDAKLKFNDDYDTYLMHGYKNRSSMEKEDPKDDPQSWYVVFISKDTCDKFENHAVLNKFPETIEYSDGIQKYILRHVQSEKLFLINRMKLVKSTGINHFKKDDLVICSLENNPMLPTNFELHSKWNIKPLTFGMNPNIHIIGNGNMAILSIPKNDSNYNRGYYEIEVQYSLNRSFVNNQFIKKKILIEK